MSHGATVFQHQSAGFSGSMAEEGLSPACVAWKKELQQDLESVNTVGDLAVHKTHKHFANPGLEVDGCLVPLPLVPLFADRIKAVAKPASFSRNGADVVDYSANLIWELDHDQFRIANPSWSAFVESIKQDVAQDLGLALSDIDVEPDKLLLYEKGSFFRRHKDSHQAPGVTGRLVICLPSEHTGGEVCLKYAGTDIVSTASLDSAFDLTALAWYSGVTYETTEITSGHRLELTYSITQRSGIAKSADFFVIQQARLKERLAGWPGDLARLVVFLDHKYSPSSLNSSNLKGRDREVVELLSSGCSEAGVYLFFGNVTKKEYDQSCDSIIDSGDDDDIGIYLDYLYTADGKEIVKSLRLSEQHLMAADHYSNRSPDGEEENEENSGAYGIEYDIEERQSDYDDGPNKLIYHDSVVILIPRNKLHCLVGPGADISAIMALIIDDQKHHPEDVTVRANMLELMNKALFYAKPTLTGLTILENAWKLNDMPLYREAFRFCTLGRSIPKELPKLLSSLVAQSTTQQVMNWSECLGGLLDCSFDVRHIFAALKDIEQALDEENLQRSFQTWVATMKRDKFTSGEFIPILGDLDNRALVSKIIETLAAKDSGNTLPGAREAAKKILNKQLQRLGLGPVNMLSIRDQEAANELDRFIDIVRVCLTSGFTEEAFKLIRNINLNVQQHQHYPEPRIISARTGTGTAYIPNLAYRLVRMLGDLLGAHRAPFMESLRGLFEYLLRCFVLPPVPVYPTQLPGWAHQPRGCRGLCKHCEELDLFLTDQQRQMGDFSHLRRVEVRDHVVERLPSNLFKCVGSSFRDLGRRDLGRNDSFLIYKISQDGEFHEALSAYEATATALRGCAKGLHGQELRRILGEDLYRELVLLEAPQVASISGHVLQTASGVKREAEEELVPPPRPALRQWVA